MSTVTGIKPNPNYLKSAIGKIYGDEDDFIVLGLTGRTGSGCSTAAQILRSSKEDMRHSLFTGESPDTNEQRKERIILRHFNATWSPFLLIQVRAVITTFLLDTDIKKSIDFFNALLPDADQQKNSQSCLRICESLTSRSKKTQTTWMPLSTLRARYQQRATSCVQS